jgi:hypothetical protein
MNMKKLISISLVSVLLCVSTVGAARAEDTYGQYVEKIHFTYMNRTMGSHDPYDAKKEIGPSNSILKIYMWGDLSNRYTKKFFDETFEQLRNKYPNALFKYSHYATLMQDKPVQAGMIAECAANQDQFWENISPLMNNLDNLDSLNYLKNIDISKMKECLKDPYTKIVVRTSTDDAAYYGFNSTPMFVIQNTSKPNQYSIKLTGAQDFTVFDQAFTEALEGDLTKKDLEEIKTKVNTLQQDVNETKSKVQEVKKQQSVFEIQLNEIRNILKSILEKLGISL